MYCLNSIANAVVIVPTSLLVVNKYRFLSRKKRDIDKSRTLKDHLTCSFRSLGLMRRALLKFTALNICCDFSVRLLVIYLLGSFARRYHGLLVAFWYMHHLVAFGVNV